MTDDSASNFIQGDPIGQRLVPVKLRVSVNRIIAQVTSYIEHGSTKNATRLAKWLLKQPNGNQIAESISGVTYTSILESRSSGLVTRPQGGKKTVQVKLNVPSIVTLVLWCDTICALVTDESTKTIVAKCILVNMFAKMASAVAKLDIPAKSKMQKSDRAQLAHYWKRLMTHLKRQTTRPWHLYMYAMLWQVALILDQVGRRRNTKYFSESFASVVTNEKAMCLYGSMIEHVYHGNQDILAEPAASVDSSGGCDADANAIAPLYMMLYYKLFRPKDENTYTPDDMDKVMATYIDMRSSASLAGGSLVASPEATLRWLQEWIVASIQIGCIVQMIDIVKSIRHVLDVNIMSHIKHFKLSSSARAVMSWNTCPGMNSYLKRLEACLSPQPGTCLQRTTSWVSRVEQNALIRDDLIRNADWVAWLQFQTCESVENLFESMDGLYVQLGKWCAAPSIPTAPSEDVASDALVSVWTRVLTRSLSARSFQDQWHHVQVSSHPEIVLGTCLPGWLGPHKQVFSRVWKRAYDALVCALCPESLRVALQRGLHPQMMTILNSYMATLDSESSKAEIKTLLDFCSWTVWSNSIERMPAFAYLYESVYRAGYPVPMHSMLEEIDEGYVLEWLSHISSRKLVVWALGIRAQQTIGLSLQIPGQIVRLVVKSLMMRSDAKQSKAWLARKFACVE